jgi:hypothetical protein
MRFVNRTGEIACATNVRAVPAVVGQALSPANPREARTPLLGAAND